ncbi:MAG: HAD hydrolase family protein [Candidatus Omnitrophota bacterium]
MTLKDIDLIVYDFDGVMTDNRVLVFQNGQEAVFCNRSDGMAVSFLKEKGVRQVILSTEENGVVSARARKLGIECIQNAHDKKKELVGFVKKNGIDLEKVLYIGNDLNDLEAMKVAGYAMCPEDAADEIKNLVNQVIPEKGGHGVIRRLWDILTTGEKDE